MADSPAATKEQVDSLMQTMKSVSDLVAKSKEENQTYIKELVENAVKNAPHFAPAPVRQPLFNGSGSDLNEKDIVSGASASAKKLIDQSVLLAKILERPVGSTKYWQRLSGKGEIGEIQKAISATGSAGAGVDWVPTGFSDRLYEFIRLETKVAALFDTIPMPNNPYVLPVQLGRLTSYKVPENTGNTAQTAVPFGDPATFTGRQTLTAVDHATATLISKNATEDSIIPLLPRIESEMITALAEGREDVILNGDITGTHEDSDVTAATDRRKLWSGIRKLALANSLTASLATFTTAAARSLRQSMGKFGVSPNKLAWIVGITDFIKLLGLPEVITAEKYGPLATILTGELAKFDGIPVIVSEWIRQDLNASGVYDGVTTTKTVQHLVFRPGYIVGDRQDAEVELLKEAYAIYRQYALVATERVIFNPVYPVATNATTAMGYNIA